MSTPAPAAVAGSRRGPLRPPGSAEPVASRRAGGLVCLPVCLSVCLSLPASRSYCHGGSERVRARVRVRVPCRRRLALAGTLQTPHNPLPLGIPACHTFDLAAGGLRNPRGPGLLNRSCLLRGSPPRRQLLLSHALPHLAPAPPRLASRFPWRRLLALPVSPSAQVSAPCSLLPCPLPTAHRPRRPLSAGPHLTRPPARASPERGAPPGLCRQVYCDTRILMLVCPASAQSLSQTDPCTWRTMALASRSPTRLLSTKSFPSCP